MDDYRNVLNRILDLIKKNGITEKKLLIDTGINTSFLTNWKKGQFKKPSYDKIQKIADYFNVSVEFLMNGESGIADALPQETKKEPLQDIEAVFKLYNALIEYGFIKPSEELTDEKVDLLIDFLSVNRRFLEHTFKNDD